jgi:competence ComEA-like helix-hairpin-helix protein
VSWIVPAVAVVLLAGAGGQARESSASQDQDQHSAQVFATVCSRCHPLERATVMRRTRSQWEEVITTMITARGAQISDEDFDTILDYLSREYGRVYINRAPADDIVEALGISNTMASTIVGYRKDHGPYQDFEALTKVPGVDPSALENKRDAIVF